MDKKKAEEKQMKQYRRQIAKSLKKLSLSERCFFTWLCVVRALPCMGGMTKKSHNYISSLLLALDCVFVDSKSADVYATDAFNTAISYAENDDMPRTAAIAGLVCISAEQAVKSHLIESIKINANAAEYAIRSADAHNINLRSILLQDLEEIRAKSNSFNNDTAMYGELWNSFHNALRNGRVVNMESGRYWSNRYENLFRNRFKWSNEEHIEMKRHITEVVSQLEKSKIHDVWGKEYVYTPIGNHEVLNPHSSTTKSSPQQIIVGDTSPKSFREQNIEIPDKLAEYGFFRSAETSFRRRMDLYDSNHMECLGLQFNLATFYWSHLGLGDKAIDEYDKAWNLAENIGFGVILNNSVECMGADVESTKTASFSAENAMLMCVSCDEFIKWRERLRLVSPNNKILSEIGKTYPERHENGETWWELMMELGNSAFYSRMNHMLDNAMYGAGASMWQRMLSHRKELRMPRETWEYATQEYGILSLRISAQLARKYNDWSGFADYVYEAEYPVYEALPYVEEYCAQHPGGVVDKEVLGDMKHIIGLIEKERNKAGI